MSAKNDLRGTQPVATGAAPSPRPDTPTMHPAGLPRVIEWVGGADGHLRLLDQTVLPDRVEHLKCTSVDDVWNAIKRLSVRGAPAIGVAAAYGLCLATQAARGGNSEAFIGRLTEAGPYLCSSRPTAVNLAWAIRRATDAVRRSGEHEARRLWETLWNEARAIEREDADMCRRIGEAGAALIHDDVGILTHCNAGALATAGIGTALAPMYVARQRGARFRVYADETRPLLQGARLTAYELSAAGIDVTVLCEGMAASLIGSGRVQLVIVGADRIAANGDTANKIGTLGLAIIARHHGVPFYAAAPSSTFDLSLPDGRGIPIEHRAEEEVALLGGRRTTPVGVRCFNPAFDVTPAALIAGIITEKGIIRTITAAAIRDTMGRQ